MAVHGYRPDKQLWEEATGRDMGATILVVLMLGLSISGRQGRWREGSGVKAQRQERSDKPPG